LNKPGGVAWSLTGTNLSCLNKPGGVAWSLTGTNLSCLNKPGGVAWSLTGTGTFSSQSGADGTESQMAPYSLYSALPSGPCQNKSSAL
jgi:hypothetical protein